MLIGYGAMAQAVIERLPAGVAIGWIVARASHHPAIHDQFGNAVEALTSPMACAQTPDLVLECASQQAVAQYGEEILRRGWHLAIISTGALADSALEQRLLAAGGKLTLLSGAVAGIDGLAAAKRAGLSALPISRAKPGQLARQLCRAAYRSECGVRGKGFLRGQRPRGGAPVPGERQRGGDRGARRRRDGRHPRATDG